MKNYGLTGTILEVFAGEVVPVCNEDGSDAGFEWADCVVQWDDGQSSYSEQWRIEPLTKPKPPLVKWEDMPCNPDGTYKEEELIYV